MMLSFGNGEKDDSDDLSPIAVEQKIVLAFGSEDINADKIYDQTLKSLELNDSDEQIVEKVEKSLVVNRKSKHDFYAENNTQQRKILIVDDHLFNIDAIMILL